MSQLRPALVVLLVLTLLTGGVYPLVTTLLGQWWFPWQSQGSLLTRGDQIRGSALLGQNFTAAGYFQGRPSATAGMPYNPQASGASHLAVSNPETEKLIAVRADTLRQQNPQATGPIPADLLSASGSGLDNGISPQAARWQLERVARARGLPVSVIAPLIARYTVRPWPSFIGAPYVNVTLLNRDLDQLAEQ